jgi:hypothetical protein
MKQPALLRVWRQRPQARCEIPTLQVNTPPSARILTSLTRSSVLLTTERAVAIDASSSLTTRTRNAAAADIGASMDCGSVSSARWAADIGEDIGLNGCLLWRGVVTLVEGHPLQNSTTRPKYGSSVMRQSAFLSECKADSRG